jgi:hypothetical protein
VIWSKPRFQQAVASLRQQAVSTVLQIDSADRSTIAAIREHDPALADLLDKGTTQRREASLAILRHLEGRMEKGDKL